jgi:capsular exopolysaccharide synthesis family protein
VVGSAPGQPAFNIAEQLARSLSALRRYKWLIAAIVAIGTSVGYALTRVVSPKYSVYATIWIAKQPGGTGPIASPGLITESLSWPDLAKSYIVLDAVVSKLGLYVQPSAASDSAVVRSLQPSPALQPGLYRLAIEPAQGRYTLSQRARERGQQDRVVEQGAVGDSIGRSVGFLWQPPAALLLERTTVDFDVITPREAAVTLSRALLPQLPTNGNLMRLSLTGDKPVLLAATLNEIATQLVEQAARLKTENLAAVAQTVEEQQHRAAEQLTSAETALEAFKVGTITLPSENMSVSGGVMATMNPVLTEFFQQKVTYQQTSKDREALQAMVQQAQGNGGRIPLESLRSLPFLLQQNSELQAEVRNLESARANLRQLEQKYTDAYEPVRAEKKRIEALETQIIPQLAAASLRELQSKEADLKRRIEGASSELQRIPQRTVEEARRIREVAVAGTIYNDLQTRAVAARLAKLSAIPDISVLDRAVAPSRPTSDTKTGIFVVAVAGSLAAALALALLLDRIDKRFRYPEQATSELGLDIMGAIPTLTNPRNSSARLEESTQLVESFRSLSLSLRSAFDGGGTVRLTISSPGPGDGKSFIAANLASAFADAGFRTLLVDGDIRRGALHKVFAPMDQSPGLLDYLASESALHEVVRPTSHSNLFVVPSGMRRRHGPELLAGEGMSALLRDLANQFDAVIVDSAPLGAGIDPFALGVATGAMLIVLRTGETDRRLAQSKLEVLDRLPVRVLGTVLNDIGENPQFKYYYYLEGYSSVDGAADAERLPAGNGASR